MQTSDFDYALPETRIAQHPMEPRDASRLMAVHRSGDLDRDLAAARVDHRQFTQVVEYLRPGDALVVNETRVIPARLLGVKADTGIPVEVLLLRRHNATDWEALVRPGRRLKPGTWCTFGDGLLRCEMVSTETETGGRLIRFHYDGIFEALLDQLGEMPLPPYIHEKLADPARYQTVYAREDGSAAAPTAGLHFTEELLAQVRAMGVHIVPVVLHVGLGTFRPVKLEDVGLEIENDGKGKAKVTLGSEEIIVDAEPVEKTSGLPLLEPIPPVPSIEANGMLIRLDSGVLFDVDKYNIRPDAYDVLTKLAEVLKQAQINSLHINGHTDSDASDEHNQVLSENRANSVKEFLEEQGVAATITTTGYGESQPIATNETKEGKQQNRRVEIVIPTH